VSVPAEAGPPDAEVDGTPGAPLVGIVVDPLARCDSDTVGAGTVIWPFAHVTAGAVARRSSKIGEHCHLEDGSTIGDRVTVKSGALIWRGVLAVVLVALASGVFAPDPADARWWGRPALVCGELPTVDVVLRSDLTCTTPFHFGPTHPAVTIDLRGHTLNVPGDAGRCTVPGPCGAIAGAAAVRNGTVVGTLSDIGEISRVIVRGDVEVRLGFAGAGGPASVRHSIVLGGMVRVWGSSVSVTDNVIRGGIDLVSTSSAIRELRIERNWVGHSPRAGIAITPPLGTFPGDIDGVVRSNLVWGSAGPGIALGGGLWNLGSLVVEGNMLVGNGSSGFHSQATAAWPPTATGGPVTLTANTAMFNRGHGFEATWMVGVAGTGVVDGGGNRSAFNAVDPPCVGITC